MSTENSPDSLETFREIGRSWGLVLLFGLLTLALGIVIYLISSVLFVKGMSRGELSVLFPMVSLGYICTLAWSRIFFHARHVFVAD